MKMKDSPKDMALKMLGLFMILSFFFVSCTTKEQPVTITEDAETYTLDNGIVTAMVAKTSGDLVSLRYQDKEMLATWLTSKGEPDLQRDPPGQNFWGMNRGMTDHQYGFWSHDAMGPRGTQAAIPTITINPETNGGERAEVSIKGISKGRKMGTGPGADADGQFMSDIEIRYSLGKGESGVYTYSVFTHQPEYDLTVLGEARFAAKLNDFFDWMSISEKQNFYYPVEKRFIDKYVLTVVQSENRAFGWSSTTENVGLFFINPSMEYMSGGPTKVEFQGHRDTNPVAAPTILNYWKSSHYGGATLTVDEGEAWEKVVGPFLIYANAGDSPGAMFTDAKKQAAAETEKWPYSWVDGVDYPSAEERATVKGKLVLNDPITDNNFSNLSVGLTAPEYEAVYPAGTGNRRPVNWQRDAKHYQFWTDGNADGTFEIDNVHPGEYSLYAFADGVLGEFLKTDVVVTEGENLDLGNLTWTPVRHGEQVWEIGIPNRNASEFFKGDEYNNPESPIMYAELFPDDVHYTIGESDFREDWYFQHVPHNTDSEAEPLPYRGVPAEGRATPYTITFDMPSAPEGTATLRAAISGNGAEKIDVEVNGKPAGSIEDLIRDGAIARHGKQGIWHQRSLSFNAALMKEGENTLTLTVPAGSLNDGVMYDYIRLELDE
ncbi:polysaccharide lyase family protein [Gracilimonas mengyeensis]|uniref:rhamnogalacturonan endolyase n=1 Tax=Gracilimonas mengyeensis TaxID=1302730 RepID=A0A521C4Z2_9BACT|nr:polysaccharide lyase family protein [Gracilimonas mengyeensis]SMO53901.1 rhamnogalacturonan endolyase [Gracilimonas mengyeensis]